MMVFNAILLAASLCADCFAVSACSSVKLSSLEWKKILPISLAFGLIQSLLLFLGWFFSDFFVGYVEKFAGAIGFLLLLYVGGGMIIEAVKGEMEPRDLNGLKNVIVGGIATSIDAFAVGVSLTCIHYTASRMVYPVAVISFCSWAISIAGLVAGIRAAQRISWPTEPAGGIVLIALACRIAFTEWIDKWL